MNQFKIILAYNVHSNDTKKNPIIGDTLWFGEIRQHPKVFNLLLNLWYLNPCLPQSPWFLPHKVVEIAMIFYSSGKSKGERKGTNIYWAFFFMWSIGTSWYRTYPGSFTSYCFNETNVYGSARNRPANFEVRLPALWILRI